MAKLSQVLAGVRALSRRRGEERAERSLLHRRGTDESSTGTPVGSKCRMLRVTTTKRARAPWSRSTGQYSSSCCLTRSRVRGGLLRETSNTSNPFLVRRGVTCCRNPRRASSERTAPTERFRSPASDLVASRISSPMLRVVLMPRNQRDDAMMSRCFDVKSSATCHDDQARTGRRITSRASRRRAPASFTPPRRRRTPLQPARRRSATASSERWRSSSSVILRSPSSSRRDTLGCSASGRRTGLPATS